MNKSDLVNRVAEKAETSRREAKFMIDVVVSTLVDALAEGEDVKMTPFGKFEVVQRAARKGRNPQTGEELNIPPRKGVKFKPGKALKEIVNN